MVDLHKGDSKSKCMHLKFLPKTASAISFQNPPNLNPFMDQKRSLRSYVGRGYSGHLISIIPTEARWKPAENSTFQAQEPTSPKVSCMGQIHDKHKHKNKIKESNQIVSASKYFSKKTSINWNIFSTAAKQFAGRKSGVSAAKFLDRAPTLSQMKRFASGRDGLTGPDWTAQIAPVELDCLSYYTDDEDRSGETKEEEITVPFLAPIWICEGGGLASESRKEVNLWKRRTMAQPRPLELNNLLLPN
ncbi:uncharacterized protein At1g76070-like [Cornus florida]|uniref:uncharacterized protein At1g76070-like n=1 Tax=Cornus florida TaxID=4283 RepID=UPI00289A9559|nr:uncharacterized protein At1g76070-like [Cornus florida]